MPQLRRSRPGPSSSSIGEVKLRKVIPVLPSTKPEKSHIMEDLAVMGCLGLADKPWGFKEEQMVKELLGKLSNQFDNTLRGIPTCWTEEGWREVYTF